MPRSVTTVSLDRTLAWRTTMLALLLAWPLILFGRPTYLAGDSLSYLKSGKIAVEFVVAKLIPHTATAGVAGSLAAGPSLAAVPGSPGDDTKTARSVPYSVAAYLLRWPGQNMTALALTQIVAASFIGAVVAGASGIRTRRRFLPVAVAAAIATPLAAFTAFMAPDVWAGVLIGALVLLTIVLDRLSNGVRLILAVMTAFAITTHASIPPLAAGMMLVGVIALVVGPRFGLRRARGAWGWLLIPPLLGFAGTMMVGFVAFGEVSVTGKRIPVALARSVSDGPARWYLERHCKTARYAVCEVFGTRIPHTIDGLLFAKNSLTDLATPEQMNRIRAEESEILIRAGLAYPGTEAYTLARNIVRQLFRFDLGLTNFKKRVALDAMGTPQLVSAGGGYPLVLDIVEFLTDMVLALSAGWAAWIFNRLENRERATLLLVILGLVGNAVICVVFSGVAERYQARVIWLLPLFILSMAAARYRSSGGADGHVI